MDFWERKRGAGKGNQKRAQGWLFGVMRAQTWSLGGLVDRRGRGERGGGGGGLGRGSCDWRVGTSIAAQSGGDACGTWELRWWRLGHLSTCRFSKSSASSRLDIHAANTVNGVKYRLL